MEVEGKEEGQELKKGRLFEKEVEKPPSLSPFYLLIFNLSSPLL